MKDNKEKNTVVGTYQNSKNFGFVVPDDTSLGTDIFISKKNKNKAKNNQKLKTTCTRYLPGNAADVPALRRRKC